MNREDDYTINDWQLATTNLHRISKLNYEVAVLPLGAVEAHNRHLPEGQDVLHTTAIAAKASQRAFEKGGKVIVLPSLPYGVDCNLMEYPLTRHGIKKVVLVNGHGGNDFVPLIRQIQSDMEVFVFLCDWWKVGGDKYDEIFDNPDDHAGEMETSIAMALYPKLIEPNVAGDGKVKQSRFEAVKQGWVRSSRDFAKLNDHCASGDPSKASAGKGTEYIELVVERLSSFLVELAESKVDKNFPFAK